jgi:HEAT repeat protein
MKGRFILFGLALSISLLTGCATVPRTSNYSWTAPPLAEGNSRIWFYALRRGAVEYDPAFVLGVVRADVGQDDVNAICAMLEAAVPGEQIGALKSLRDLNPREAVPRIFPPLRTSNPGVVRDACRTLAVLGDDSAIARIELLLQHADKAVQEDAKDTIFQLTRKPRDIHEVKNRI